MRQASALCLVIAAGLLGADRWLGYRTTYEIGYGALTLMAAMIAATFLWLWWERTTPLALGMAFGWAGAGGLVGWWWAFHLLDRPAAMVESEVLFVFLSLYFVGAILHFAVIRRSLGLPARWLGLPLSLAAGTSALVHMLS